MVQTRRTINIDSKAEYSWHLAHPVLYLVGSIGCSVLWTAPIQRNHHWDTNNNWCNEALKQKRPEKTSYAKRHDNARLHVAKPVKETLEALNWDVTLAVFSRYCSFRLSPISIDDSWPVWTALAFLWRYEKMGRFVDSLKRCIVLSAWNSPITRKIGKSSG